MSARIHVISRVRSRPSWEIVVPIFVKNQVAGELDIDSHFAAAFGAEDQQLVQFCAELVGKKLEQSLG